MDMPSLTPWGPADALAAALMWAVMMVAMMTPSAAPTVLTYDRLRQGSGRAGSAVFAAGYLLVWLGFSIVAALLQWGLQRAGLLTGDAMRAAPLLGGALLLTTGAWQLSSTKDRCLTLCRSPLSFLMAGWRDGRLGALQMGVRHGLVCVGCCWALMLVLFAAGIMNLLWVVAIAGWVLLEKTVAGGRRLARAGGVLAIAWGVWVITASFA